MAPESSLWWPDDPVDIYDGKVFALDGRAAWVLRRVHRSSGWCVEVRAGDPNGELLSRSWLVHAEQARRHVEALRREIAHTTLDALSGGTAEPPPPRGIVAAHGMHDNSGSPGVAVADEPTSAAPLCATFWLPPGRVGMLWDRSRPQTVEVHAGEVVHVGGHGIPFPGLPRPVRRTISRWWFCPLRSLRFEHGAVPANVDVRAR